jgi:hypothetical protein
MWKRFQKVLPLHPGRHGGGLMSTGASQSPPRIVPKSSESARDVIALQPARAFALHPTACEDLLHCGAARAQRGCLWISARMVAGCAIAD